MCMRGSFRLLGRRTADGTDSGGVADAAGVETVVLHDISVAVAEAAAPAVPADRARLSRTRGHAALLPLTKECAQATHAVPIIVRARQGACIVPGPGCGPDRCG